MDEYKRRRRRSRAVMSMFLGSSGVSIDDVDIATFDSDGSDLKALIASIEPIQAGTGDPSPDNVRPISGHTDVVVTRTGKNLWNFDRTDRVNGFYDASGNFVTSFSFCCLWYPCAVGMQFIKSGSRWGGINTYWNGNTFLSSNNTASPTIPSGANIVKFACQYASTDAQLELGSTATDYEEYRGTTYSIPLGQTVYGGTLDVLTGVLTVTHANISSYNGEAINEPWISSMDAYSPGATPTTGAQVVYTLSTPTTIQLTGQQIATFVGTNNVWCSSGQVIHLEY